MNLKMLYAQQKHIESLQEKLNIEKENFTNKFLGCDDWRAFVSRHMLTYRRPSNIFTANKFDVNKIEIEFDKQKNAIPTSCKLYIYVKGSVGILQTNYIDIDELETFMSNSEVKDKTSVEDNRYWCSTPTPTPQLTIKCTL